jgi:hypothetical protein
MTFQTLDNDILNIIFSFMPPVSIPLKQVIHGLPLYRRSHFPLLAPEYYCRYSLKIQFKDLPTLLLYTVDKTMHCNVYIEDEYHVPRDVVMKYYKCNLPSSGSWRIKVDQSIAPIIITHAQFLARQNITVGATYVSPDSIANMYHGIPNGKDLITCNRFQFDSFLITERYDFKQPRLLPLMLSKITVFRCDFFGKPELDESRIAFIKQLKSLKELCVLGCTIPFQQVHSLFSSTEFASMPLKTLNIYNTDIWYRITSTAYLDALVCENGETYKTTHGIGGLVLTALHHNKKIKHLILKQVHLCPFIDVNRKIDPRVQVLLDQLESVKLDCMTLNNSHRRAFLFGKQLKKYKEEYADNSTFCDLSRSKIFKQVLIQCKAQVHLPLTFYFTSDLYFLVTTPCLHSFTTVFHIPFDTLQQLQPNARREDIIRDYCNTNIRGMQAMLKDYLLVTQKQLKSLTYLFAGYCYDSKTKLIDQCCNVKGESIDQVAMHVKLRSK